MDPAELQATVTKVSAATMASNVAIRVGEKGKELNPLCAGFVVRENLAATSAQCVVAIESAKQQGKTVTVLVGGVSSDIGDMWRHPDHQPGGPNADVGLLRIDSHGAPAALPAPVGDLVDLDEGDTIVVGSTIPVGVALTGVQAIPGGAVFQHGVSAPSGTPLYDATNQLVGLHAHLSKEPSMGPGPGFGVRADLLIALLAGLQ